MKSIWVLAGGILLVTVSVVYRGDLIRIFSARNAALALEDQGVKAWKIAAKKAPGYAGGE